MLLRISSQDNTFPEFFESLAQALRDQGTVYTPYPAIPPEARMAIPRPTNVLVVLDSADAFDRVHEVVRDYLTRGPQRELTLEKESRAIVVTGPEVPDAEELLNRLLD
jgi:hypothetical protein